MGVCIDYLAVKMAGQPTLQNLRTPPILAGEESYLEWLEDLKVWVLFTDLVKKNRDLQCTSY